MGSSLDAGADSPLGPRAFLLGRSPRQPAPPGRQTGSVRIEVAADPVVVMVPDPQESVVEPPDRRSPPLREAVVHIGLGKTGTTSVQTFLSRNRERLARLDLLVPVSAGRGRHTALGSFVRTREELERSIEWQRLGVESLRDWRRDFRRRLRREIVNSGSSRALFTDEDLFSSSERAIERMRGLMSHLADDVRIVVYLRRQDDHLISRYQQTVKIGEVVRLDEYAARSWAWKYDYAHQLDRWQAVLDPARMVVRRYEPGRFLQGSLHQDFLDAIGIDACASDFEQVEDQNAALGVEAAEFMRLMNIYRVEHEGATPYLIDNRRLGRRLRDLAPDGPTLTLPEPALDRFMEHWAASNHRVARTYFDEDDLFRDPRKTRNTTSIQRFDPDRLDVYFEGLEIPAAQRDAIRGIAEREAARGEALTGSERGWRARLGLRRS